VREEFPNKTIMAGNVVTGEMVEELILSGADIIKVRKSLPGRGIGYIPISCHACGVYLFLFCQE
jgi:hypothetical protein